MPVPRNYSDNYLSGMDPDPKRNVAVECFQIDTTRFATTYIVLILIVYGAIHGSGYTSEQSLSATNVAHALVTFVFFHWAKGSPDTHAQGDYDDLTVWEQLDGGASWSATKKVFLIVPTLVLLAYLNAADFSRHALAVHVPVYALLCILPKLPGMHRVRILAPEMMEASARIAARKQMEQGLHWRPHTLTPTNACFRYQGVPQTANLNLAAGTLTLVLFDPVSAPDYWLAIFAERVPYAHRRQQRPDGTPWPTRDAMGRLRLVWMYLDRVFIFPKMRDGR